MWRAGGQAVGEHGLLPQAGTAPRSHMTTVSRENDTLTGSLPLASERTKGASFLRGPFSPSDLDTEGRHEAPTAHGDGGSSGLRLPGPTGTTPTAFFSFLYSKREKKNGKGYF